jgi:hypothetical protein
MKLIPALREYLQTQPRRQFRNERVCTCGESNHARMVMFRVEGRSVAAIVPEYASLDSEQFRRAIGAAHVQRMDEAELDDSCVQVEFACLSPFENAVGTDVYLDQQLAEQRDIVFCPEVAWGGPAGCFRINTATLRKRLHCVVLPLVTAHMPPSELFDA